MMVLEPLIKTEPVIVLVPIKVFEPVTDSEPVIAVVPLPSILILSIELVLIERVLLFPVAFKIEVPPVFAFRFRVAEPTTPAAIVRSISPGVCPEAVMWLEYRYRAVEVRVVVVEFILVVVEVRL
jgi:hypothetical protein